MVDLTGTLVSQEKTEKEEKIKNIHFLFLKKRTVGLARDGDKETLRVTGCGRLVADHEAIFVWS
jgi:hypothetical protein